jgi:hypothetical protein
MKLSPVASLLGNDERNKPMKNYFALNINVHSGADMCKPFRDELYQQEKMAS